MLWPAQAVGPSVQRPVSLTGAGIAVRVCETILAVSARVPRPVGALEDGTVFYAPLEKVVE